MAKTPGSNAVRKTAAKAKPSRTTAPVASANRAPTIDVAAQLDENLVRDRAYDIWIALAHWQLARQALRREA